MFGKQVEDFLNGDIGVFVTRRATEEIDDCLEQLKAASPHFWWGRRKIARLQSRIAVAERVIHWLAEAVHEGHQAMEIIEGKND